MGPDLKALPEGFSFEEEDEEEVLDSAGLPEGFSFESEEKKSIFEGTKPLYKPSDPAEDEGKSWWERMRDSFGRSLAMQAQVSGGGGPQALPVYKHAGQKYASGLTLGLSENIPGMEPIDTSTLPEDERGPLELIGATSKLTGELAPIERLMKIFKLPGHVREGAPLVEKSLNSLLNILKAGGVGATVKGLEDVFQGKVPDYGDVIEHGATWAALDAILQGGGAIARAIEGAFERNIEQGANGYETLNRMSKELQEKGVDLEKIDEFAQEAFEILNRDAQAAEERALNPDVRGRNLRERKVEKEFFEDITQELPEEIEAPEIKVSPDELPREPVVEESLDTIAERAEDKMELGENVQADVNRRVRAAKDEYKPRYDLASEAAELEEAETNNIVNRAWRSFERIRGNFRTTPEDYEKTLGVLEGLMTDLGAQFERNEQGRIVGMMFTDPIALDTLMELGRRSGRLAKYGNLNPTIRDAVKTVNQDIKALIKDTLKGNPEALQMWTEAEELFREKSRIFDNPTVLKIRNEGFKPEDIGSIIKKPSDLQKVKEAVSPEQFKQIERELLAEMNEMSYEKGNKLFRELRRNMSEDSKKLADEILLSKKPVKKMSQGDKNKELERWITNKVSQAAPSPTLNKLWDTKLGQQRIRRSLTNNPNKDRIIEFLQNQKIQNSSKKWVKESGELNYGEMKKWLSKSENRQAIRDAAGLDGLKFMDELSKFSDKAKQKRKIYEILENKPLSEFKPPKRGDELIEKLKVDISRKDAPLITKVEDLWQGLSEDTKNLLSLAGMFKFGVYKTLLGAKSIPMLLRAAKHPRLRNAVRKAMDTKSTNPWVIYGIWKGIEDELD